MKIKLDENMPAGLATVLNRMDHDVVTVPEEGLAGRDDLEIWAAAQREGRFLITQDLDFSDVRKYRPGSHHGIMVVRLRGPGRLALLEKVCEVFEAEDIGSWNRCFIVLTERKIRIHSP
ncbi:MAG: DUF5615 family PIN-like protein [Deltaproteobacteria bacterium]|nr:DUF5615 family PIN-like protein [Deltaproteobacteria bacterium]MBW1910211.1 DUF5615 family PIN-like protein [Deltaproteobacteria bacterium]MBW2034268.1 DUF5615 family PIN-like protein [Deltaproteobacteria bacterium]MBW2115509.1 DUF5615 family PIN-like protein [Deltaproteobacteria bacterium]